MALTIYNSQTRQKDEFMPLTPGKVGMYVCGVTVYDDPHVGHARCYVAFDAILRHLKAKGYAVTYVRNFTDVDDKIIKRAQEKSQTCQELTEHYIKSFQDDMAALSNLPADIEPKATEHIPEIIAQVQAIIANGHGYATDDGDVYFSVMSLPEYGSLSGRDLEQMQAGARVEVDSRKKHPMDFALWKSSKPDEPAWESPWGMGRPGWHIECSAMSQKYLGATFDIHGGGKDLVFPHHENELAQAEAVTGHPLARYWLHNGFVQIDQEKMSKSLGNFFTIKELLKHVHPETLRLFLLNKHYRSPLDFSKEALEDAGHGLWRLYNALYHTQQIGAHKSESLSEELYASRRAELETAESSFYQGMNDDFNTAAALGAIFSLTRSLNRALNESPSPERDAFLMAGHQLLLKLGNYLGLLNEDPQAFLQGQDQASAAQERPGVDAAEVEELMAARQAARKAKNFSEADRIRDELHNMGIVLEDTPQGTTWRMA